MGNTYCESIWYLRLLTRGGWRALNKCYVVPSRRDYNPATGERCKPMVFGKANAPSLGDCTCAHGVRGASGEAQRFALVAVLAV